MTTPHHCKHETVVIQRIHKDQAHPALTYFCVDCRRMIKAAVLFRNERSVLMRSA